MVLGQPRQLVVDAGAGCRRLPVEALQHLAVADGELPVVPVARVVEQPADIVGREVLDLLDADEGGLAPSRWISWASHWKSS